MDVEKTIEFLLSNQAGHDERLARIENTVDKLSVDVATLTGNVEALTLNVNALTRDGATLHDSVRTLAITVDKMTDSILVVNRQSEERDRQLGERIDQLATAIGEFVRNRPSAG